MIFDVIMPKMGESVNEGTIIKWYKNIGDKVKLDETIFEISTDKVDTEIPSPAEGVLTEILVNVQETVPIGTVVARISTEGEAAVKQPLVNADTAPENPVEYKAVKEEKAAAKTDAAQSSSFFSPLVLNIAKVENVSFEELETINGTGQGGRVTKKDILAYVEVRKNNGVKTLEVKKEADNANYSSAKAAGFREGTTEVIPMDNVRQKIMRHMVESRDTSVHVSAVVEVDMSRVEKTISLKKEEFLKNEGINLTYMPFIAQAVVKGLKEFPLINASVTGNEIIRKKYINLGVAVAVEPNGLIVPNIKNADEKNLTGFAKAIKEIAVKARGKKLLPDDIAGGTFTITNYGVFGSLFGTPIINQPEVAILGVGAVVKRAVVIEADGVDTIAIKPMMYLSLSHDHRLVDGMLGGRFLKFIKDALENYPAGQL
jgi:2-oxoglutarate dehydrogenase E2 component (dihydrolipoamide succinyltransferase)